MSTSKKCTYIDGIGSSQAIDTAGEIVDLAGLDCSSLIGAAFNYEHKSEVPAQLVGKILNFKKIFSDKDCDTDRQLYYWNKCQIPFLYVIGRLFDDKKDSSKEIAALFKDDAENPDEPDMLGFSVEGAKIHKQGMTITHSIARKVTITHLPANKTCVAEMMPASAKNSKDDFDHLFKGEIDFFKPSSKYLEFLQKKEEMKKDVGSGGGAFIGSQLASSEMNKADEPAAPKGPGLPKGWKPFKGTHGSGTDMVGFSHPEHGKVTVHKDKESGKYHVSHIGGTLGHTGLAGVMGQKGVFDKPKEALQHAAKYTNAYHQGKVMGRIAHADPMAKAMDAGSSMGAPSQLTQGAALSPEAGMKMYNTGMSKKKKSQALVRAEQAYGSWEKREEFEKFMKDRLPNLSKNEVKAIGQALALKKSIKAEGALAKMFASHYFKKENEIGTKTSTGLDDKTSSLDKTTDAMMAGEKK